MNRIETIILLLGIAILTSCGNHHKWQPKEFVEQHGKDDYSIFEGATLFHRSNRGDTAVFDGLVPMCKGDTAACFIIVYCSRKDSVVLNFECYRFGNAKLNHTEIDSTYIDSVSKRFMQLGVFSIQMPDNNDVDIMLNNENDRLYRIQDITKRDTNHLKKISENWYVPI